jgi:hypothetical protein
MQKFRWLVQTLILSTALNAALLCTFFYFLIRDNPLHFSYRPKEEIYHEPPPLTSTLLRRLQTFSFADLVELLDDSRKVEYGYRIRDFALSSLASFHDFDVERALGRGRLSKKQWEYEGRSFLLFPRLQDEDFETLRSFASTERWPFTPRGLFREIQEKGIEKSDPALIHFFCHTPPFILLETLFARTHLPIRKRNLLALTLESGWERVEAFSAKEEQERDFSAAARVAFLIDAIEGGSKTATYLLLITDPLFAVKELDDEQTLKILDLLTVKTQEAQRFVQLTAQSPRCDEVRQKAMGRLAEYRGESTKEIAGHFYEKPGLKELRPLFRQQPPAAPDPATHIIQPGESLWLIARKYRVPIELLIETNHLQSTVIRPGHLLKIPHT